jgi:hypothetical protein
MKPTSLSAGRWISLCVLAFALTGCTRQTIRLETVDANTGTPLAGVTTEWREHRYLAFRRITHSPPMNLPPTGQSGIVEIRDLHRNWTSAFIFSCPGYSKVYGRYDDGQLKLGTNVDFDLFGSLKGDFRFAGNSNVEMTIKSKGLFVIPMSK